MAISYFDPEELAELSMGALLCRRRWAYDLLDYGWGDIESLNNVINEIEYRRAEKG